MRSAKARLRAAMAITAIAFSAIALSVLSCGEGKSERIWTGTSGETVSWGPAEPKIGDEVVVEARGVPADGPTLRGPDGSTIAPIAEDARGGVRWAFRLTEAGRWTWGTDKGARVLWAAETAAGEATELKSLDAQYLWTGKSPKKAAP